MSDINVRAVLTRQASVALGSARDEYHWLSNQKYKGPQVQEAISEGFVPLIADEDSALRGAAVCWFSQNRHKPAGEALLAAYLDRRSLYEGQPQPWLPVAQDQLGLLELALKKCHAVAWHRIEQGRATAARDAMLAEQGLTWRALSVGACASAAEGDRVELQRLVALGAPIGRRTEEPEFAPHRHPIHVAAQHGHVDVLRWLVRAGAEVDARDGDGLSPMAVAADHGQVDAVKALMELGANPNHYAADGNTPLTLARKQPNKKALVAAMGRKR